MNQAFQNDVKTRLQGRYHLIPLFSHVHDIPQRLYEYDPNLFCVYNTNTGKYEIHSLNHFPDTHALNVPYGELDVRALRYLWRNDLRVHGRDIFRRIDAGEAAAENRKKREWKNWVEDVAKETQSMFAKDAWIGG